MDENIRDLLRRNHPSIIDRLDKEKDNLPLKKDVLYKAIEGTFSAEHHSQHYVVKIVERKGIGNAYSDVVIVDLLDPLGGYLGREERIPYHRFVEEYEIVPEDTLETNKSKIERQHYEIAEMINDYGLEYIVSEDMLTTDLTDDPDMKHIIDGTNMYVKRLIEELDKYIY